MQKEKAEIMDANAMHRAITRISFEIIEKNKGLEGICLVGILSRGAVLAQRVASRIAELEQTIVPVGVLDISPFRDDRPSLGTDRSEIAFEVDGRCVVLVDDVIFTGRSVRAAIDALMRRGRPRKVQLAALIDRGHRELPIRADFIGKNLPTSTDETVQVQVVEQDGVDRVVILQKEQSQEEEHKC